MYTGDKCHVTRRTAARESGLDEATVQTIFSELVSSDVLNAKIQIRCPYCTTQHGIYTRKCEVPKSNHRCFKCDSEFDKWEESTWGVIYKIASDPGDFFQGHTFYIKRFIEAAQDLPPKYFGKELERFRTMENPQRRGREFDYFMGLLFQQIAGIEVRLKEIGNSGEVDVHAHCLDAPDWIHRLVGSQTLIENKWQNTAVEKEEVSNFYMKATEVPSCNIAYFISMSGYSRGKGKQTGALANLRNYENPSVVEYWEDDVESMVEIGTPEYLLRNRLID